MVKNIFCKKDVCQAALAPNEIMHSLFQMTPDKASVQGLAVLSPEDLIILLGIPYQRVAQL